MKRLFFLCVVSLASRGWAQPPVITRSEVLGGLGWDYSYQSQTTADGGCIVAGGSTGGGEFGTGHGTYDAWVVKLSDTGGVQWQKVYGGGDTDVAVSIINTNDGGYMMAAHSASSTGDVTGNHGHLDIWLVKMSATGAIQWQRSYGGSGEEHVSGIRQTADSGYIVAGSTNSSDGDVSPSHGGNDYWILKLTKTGGITWQRVYGGSGEDIATAIMQTSSGDYLVGGYSTSTDGDVTGNHGGEDFWVSRLSATGDIIWERSLGGSHDDFANTVLQDADGGFIVAGGSNSADGDITTNKGMGDGWIVKLSPTGGTVWQVGAGGSKNDAINSIQRVPGGGYIAAGFMDSESDPTFRGATDYWLLKISAVGAVEWQRCMGSLGIDVATSVQVAPDSGYYVSGYSFYMGGDVANNNGHCDYWVVKLNDAKLALAPETVKKDIAVFPNPVVTYGYLEGVSNCTIYLYNAFGRLLSVSGNTDRFSLSDQIPGAYLIKIYGADGLPIAEKNIVKR